MYISIIVFILSVAKHKNVIIKNVQRGRAGLVNCKIESEIQKIVSYPNYHDDIRNSFVNK